MREPERDRGRLEHMVSAIGRVEEYTSGVTKSQLISDPMRLHATVYNVQIVDEATYKLSKEFKQMHPKTPWRMIEKMRHILVHGYYQINNDILWDVITGDLTPLKLQLLEYLAE